MSIVLKKIPRSTAREQLLTSQAETALQLSGAPAQKTWVLLAEPGQLYGLVQSGSGRLLSPARVERQKNKLLLQLDDEQTIEIHDFFDEDLDQPVTEYVLASADQQDTWLLVTSDAGNPIGSGAGPGGDALQLLWTSRGFTGNLDSISLDMVPAAFQASAVPALLALAGLSLAGSGASSAAAQTVSTGTVVQGRFVAGPVLPGHDLVVGIYDLADRALGTAKVDADGRFRINIGNHLGPIVAKVYDDPASQAVDFFDEALQAGKDLNAFMMAVEVVVEANTVITLNVNEATTTAARLAGWNPVDGSGNMLAATAAATIQSANATVARLIGLSEPLPSAMAEPVYLANGSLNAQVNELGKFLAAVSGMAEDMDGDMGAAINTVAAGMDTVQGQAILCFVARLE